MRKYIQAKLNKVPFKLTNIWVEGKRYCRERLEEAPDCELLSVTRDNGKNDAIVPLLKRGSVTYFYKVTSASRAPGDDHIISPWSFDFKYHHSLTA